MSKVHATLFISMAAAAVIEMLYHLPAKPNAVAGAFALVAVATFCLFVVSHEE